MISVAPKTPINMTNRSPTANLNITGVSSSKPITKIVMSKEWVLPPRPKPGRKPCEDIPSSKRKAQNRAAQRAFRERRANRVSELEEKIMDMERDRTVSEGILNNMIKTLQNENKALKALNSKLKNENFEINSKLSKITENNISSSNSTSFESLFNLEPQSAVPLKRKLQEKSSISNSGDEIDFTNTFVFKKPRKMPKLKDVFINNNNDLSMEPSEVLSSDTTKTTMPSKTTSIHMAKSISLPVSDNIPFESCGFCSEESPCVCREIETEQQIRQQEEIKNIKEAKLKSDIEKKERELILELTKSATREDISQIAKCTGNPGTCLQCRDDPLSTLFCKTVAEKASKDDIKLPSIDNKTALSSIDLNLNNKNNNNNIKNNNNNKGYQLPSIESLKLIYPEKQFIPCADAYKTISNHLDVQNVGVNKITSNLQTKGMFVEVGSVVSCLRELDRKFSSS